jgi:cell division protease FtsH
MKHILRNRKNFALADFFAYCAISAAVRHIRRAKHFAVGLVISEWAQVDTFYRASHAVLKPGNERHDLDIKRLPIVFNDYKPSTSHSEVVEAIGYDRVIILFETEASIPADIRPTLDIVVRVGMPSIQHVKGVMRWRYRIEVSDLEADVLLHCDWSRLNLLTRPGRPISRVLKALMKPMGAPPSSAMPGEKASEMRLETMAGYGEAKNWGLDLAADIRDWKEGRIRWNDVDKGLLLSGPPGTGKTIFANALGRTCGVPVIHASAAKWQAKGHLGDFLKAMIGSFEEAKKRAPSVLFIDELDSFGDRMNARDDNQAYEIKAINGLLECLDGAQARDGVVVVGACNNADLIDSAILRSGRLDKHVRIELPDTEARTAILRMHLQGDLAGVDLSEFAHETEGATGADIARMIRDARRLARRQWRSVLREDMRAVMPMSVSIPTENLLSNAIHEIGHAVVGIELGLDLTRVTISSTARITSNVQALGGARFAAQPWARRTRQHYLDHIALYMAGIAAEGIFLGQHDDGASGGEGSDLHRATRIAIDMERSHGMGEHLASYGEVGDRRLDEIKHLDGRLMSRVDGVLREQLSRAVEIINRHRRASKQLHQELLERMELSGPEVHAAVEQALMKKNDNGRDDRDRGLPDCHT